MRGFVAVAFAAVLSACTTVSPIAEIGNGIYAVSERTLSPFRTRSSLLENATEEADEFCGQIGAVARLVDAEGKELSLSSRVEGHVRFRCVSAPPPVVPRIRPVVTTVSSPER